VRSGTSKAHNVAIEYRWVGGQLDLVPALISEFINRRVALIGAFVGAPGAIAAKAANVSIPILFVLGVDPVKFGVVASLNRPGGTITGITLLDATLSPKHVQLLREIVPTATLIGFLTNPDNPSAEDVLPAAEHAARSLGVTILALKARNGRDIEQAFTTAIEQRVGALIIGADPFFNTRVDQIAALALRHALPTMHSFREFALAGGLISYGTSPPDAYRHMGVYAGRGESPANLPVLQPTRFELVINLKTAKSLGLTVPQTLQVAADEVIE
jgi:putative ABC transport system substrate-binding protein